MSAKGCKNELCVRPVVVPAQQQHSLSEDPDILPTLVHVRYTLGDLILQSNPVMYLRKQTQQVSGQENTFKKTKQLKLGEVEEMPDR